ncbi:macro domain-containing protein [Hymenobacter ruricola]|uniref:Macro domain-containing protein n=1 Tax=Hymenobacter ruricola TaxID=2791023 RepID=A0ABS0I186_9BACT|nr:macro domain-containing protein [Hymenobacter ruricola]MBF9220698.1 macro domain-containing protein [Hymenobacter ruricola]
MNKLILVDPNQALCEAWQSAFQMHDEVKIVNNVFESVKEYDCMVSAANSFGLMDGGVDLAITKYFGNGLQSRVQAHIMANYNGEQPVGSSFIIGTSHAAHPYLAHTPTMRVPMSINGTDNVYLAMKAMLQAVKSFNAQTARIQIVLCPGLGTATGRVAPEAAAAQMALAYEYYKKPPQEITWESAAKISREVFAAI